MQISNRVKGLAAITASGLGVAATLALLPSLAFGADITGEDSASGTTASTIETEEQCTWYVTNVPAAIALAPADPDAEYEGNALDVSYTAANLDVRASGNVAAPDISSDATTFVDCTFYGTDNVSRPTLGIAIATSDFDATYGVSDTADATLDFTLDGDNAFDISYTPDASICGALSGDKYGIWSVSTLGLYGVTNDGTETGTVLEILATPVSDQWIL